MAADVGRLALLLAGDSTALNSALASAAAQAAHFNKQTISNFGGVSSAAAGMGRSVTSALGSIVDGLGKIGLAGMGLQTLASAASGLGSALGIGLNAELETTRAQLLAFTKSGEQADQILADIRKEASTTPFAFQEMAKATASLLPASKQSGVALMDLVKQAEILAALNPAEGLEGAAFALKEALGGDFVSIVERFNLPRQTLNKLKEEGVPAMEAVRRAMAELGADSDLVSGLANTASGRWSTLMDTFDTLRASLSQPLFEAASAGLAQLQTALDAAMPTLEGIADAAGKALAAFVTGEGFDRFYESLTTAFSPQTAGLIAAVLDPLARVRTAINQFASGDTAGALDTVRGAASAAFETLQSAAGQAVAWVKANGPQLAAAFGEWAAAAGDWVLSAVPPLLNKLADMREAAFSWLVDQVPGLIDTLGTWATAITAWVGPRIPVLLEELGKMASRTLDWIKVQAPPLAEKFLAEWAPAAIKWVAQAAGNLLKELPSILTTIGTWVLQNAPKVADLAVDLGKSLVTGILRGLGNLAAQLTSFLLGEINGALDSVRAFFGLGGSGGGQQGGGTTMRAQSVRRLNGSTLLPVFDRDRAVQDAQMAAEAAKLNFKTSQEWNEILKWESLTSQKVAELALNAKVAAERAANMADVMRAAAEGRQAQREAQRAADFANSPAGMFPNVVERFRGGDVRPLADWLSFASGRGLDVSTVRQVAAQLGLRGVREMSDLLALTGIGFNPRNGMFTAPQFSGPQTVQIMLADGTMLGFGRVVSQQQQDGAAILGRF